ncbi:MAG: 3-keto-disaccharide hydrolase [Chloroflexota bacterium]|nr:3-keto-disaccharide hydrolase [Chloroflexota bacterium]
MGDFWDFSGRLVGVVSLLLTGVGFLMLLRQIKKTNRVRAGSILLSMVFSVLMLLFNLLVMNRAPLYGWLLLFLIFGGGFGLAWGRTTRLDLRDQRIVGQRSVIYIYFWLASLLVTQVLGLAARVGVVSLGLAGMFFSTGAALGTNGNILFRMKRLAAGAPQPDEVEAGVEREPVPPQSVQTARPARGGCLRRAVTAVGAVVLLLVVAFVLVRFVFADQIFPIHLTVGGEPVTIALPGSVEAEQRAESANLPEQPIGADLPDLGTAPQAAQESVDEPTGDELPQPRAVSEADLILDEDFANSDTGAQALYSEEYMEFYVTEGLGVIDSRSTPALLPVLFPGVEAADFIAEFEFMLPIDEPDCAAGLIFRADPDPGDGLDWYYALHIYPAKNSVRMAVWQDGEWRSTDPVEPTTPLYVDEAFNRVRVEVQGNYMTLFINDAYVAEYFLDSISDAGLLGLFLSASEAVQEDVIDFVFFESIKVYKNGY